MKTGARFSDAMYFVGGGVMIGGGCAFWWQAEAVIAGGFLLAAFGLLCIFLRRCFVDSPA